MIRPFLRPLTMALLLAPALHAHSTALAHASVPSDGPWTSTGDVAEHTGVLFELFDVGPQPQLLLGTASDLGHDDFPHLPGAYRVSSSGSAVAADGTLEAALGLAGGALNQEAQGQFVQEGSAATRTFDVNAGDTLSLTWQLFTREGADGLNLGDAAWLVLDQGEGASVHTLGATDNLLLTAIADGWSASASHRHEVTFTSSGRVTLGLAVGDMTDSSVTTVLAVGGVVVTPAVPEASSVSLAVAGLMVAGIVGGRRRRARG